MTLLGEPLSEMARCAALDFRRRAPRAAPSISICSVGCARVRSSAWKIKRSAASHFHAELRGRAQLAGLEAVGQAYVGGAGESRTHAGGSPGCHVGFVQQIVDLDVGREICGEAPARDDVPDNV